jgi:hypothetical protein
MRKLSFAAAIAVSFRAPRSVLRRRAASIADARSQHCTRSYTPRPRKAQARKCSAFSNIHRSRALRRHARRIAEARPKIRAVSREAMRGSP